ncbi:B3 domain-containing transcription factor VRN1-like isoform X1 [Cucurbita pepo subsp. pepo]|uniref:B3 domain-containing transcription factor VRN1-like isoform X1 n=1 Tax=Cucurbita pepo subsp. pepo TaxID=3664 RepID=UPI000C9D546E|nr:B3 domain-containing transcription factor VRN1-like isoform X1 [Cucurbita pepo subsp. pepo]
MAPSSPQFFRIVLHNNLEDRKLMIPKKFVKDHGELLSTSVRLKLPDGMEWKVGLTTAPNGVVWLQNGWHKFAEHYSLEFGSLLVFKSDGFSTFQTSIFDPSGVETEYCCIFNDSRAEFTMEYEDSDENTESSPLRLSKRKNKPSVPSPPQSRKKMKPEEEGCLIIKNMPKTEAGVSSRRQQFVNKPEAAQRFTSKSEKPIFKIVMKQPNVRGKFAMTIPKDFAEKHLPDDFGIIKLQTPNGRKWPLLYKRRRNQENFVYFSSGWKRFVEENVLKEGDIGLFQLIKKDIFSFTKLQDTSPFPSPATNTRNPCFEANILNRRHKKFVLNIPMVFAKEHFSSDMRSAKLQVGNRQWIVALRQYGSSVRLSAGWCLFYGDNGLEDGDSCLFEMVDTKNCVFKVTIFKHVSSSASMD